MFIGGLSLKRVPIDRSAIESRRRASLQPSDAKAELLQRFGKFDRRRFAGPSSRIGAATRVYATVKKSAGGDDYRLGADSTRVLQLDPNRALVLNDQVSHNALAQAKVWRRFQSSAHLQAIECAVGLRSRGPNGGPARSVKQAKLNPGSIDKTAHDPAEGVNLSDKMTLTNAPDGWIARHLPDQVQVKRHQSSISAETCGGRCRFAAGVPTPNYNHIKNFIEDHKLSRPLPSC